MSAPAIDIAGLTKSFGRFQALRGLDLEVTPGTVHGFLGPNGAGKSTTIRVLLGLLRADGGRVRLLGGNPWTDIVPLHRRLAYVPGDVVLWPGMSGGEAIDLLGAMRGGLNECRRAELIERFELDPAKKGRQYSKGNRQKVAIVAALASDVELLILDEPTSGLDPLMENVFQEALSEATHRGATVLLSSHIMNEVENLADHLSIIREGRIVRTGTLVELRGQSHTTVRATLTTPPADNALSTLGDVTTDGRQLTATIPSDTVGQAMELLTACGIESLAVEPPSLKDLFLSYYEDLSDAGANEDGTARDAPTPATHATRTDAGAASPGAGAGTRTGSGSTAQTGGATGAADGNGTEETTR